MEKTAEKEEKPEGLTRLQIILELVAAGIIIAMIVYVIFWWKYLPRQIPIHFNAKGEIDQWGGKGGLVADIVIGIFVYGVVSAAGVYFKVLMPQWQNKESRKLIHCTRTFLAIVKIQSMMMIFMILIFTVRMKEAPIIYPAGLIVLISVSIIVYLMKLNYETRKISSSQNEEGQK